jgi:multiple sugar transport system ATP-binding protein
MEGGVLQQYATPAELKLRPANLFTGTFIGEPPMNVFNASVKTDAKTVSFTIDGGVTLTYPANELSAPVQSLLSKQQRVAIGIRPHALHMGNGPIKGKVVSCQWLGDQTHVAVEIAGRTVVSVAHERVSQKTGSDIELNVAAGDLHLFDAASGDAIAHGSDLA